MKAINLTSLINAKKSLPQDLFNAYLEHYSIKIKNSELDDLDFFLTQVVNLNSEPKLFDAFYVGFSIPQIGKEFDLLRFGSQKVINIELKRISTTDKIKEQLIKNKYYLSFLKKEIALFSYVSCENKLYSLDANNNLFEVSLPYLINFLLTQEIQKFNIENLFNPTDYLVSPFNSTEDFINGKYFLTTRQETIKREIIDSFAKKNISFISIKGKAGTGKTLLTYDIAKFFNNRQDKVLIIHCGILNDGHYKLKNELFWDIIAIKYLNLKDLSNYDLIIVDECQRIYPSQLLKIVDEVKTNGNMAIFSYDARQYLRNWELNNNIEKIIEDQVKAKVYELTTKIRTNKEISALIRCLFNKQRPIEKGEYHNIEINYFTNKKDVKVYVEYLRNNNWKTINYTPSTRTSLPYEEHHIFDEVDNSHTIIGQEFDNVIAIIDQYFYYNGDRLSTKNYSIKPYYHPTKMLYQIMTRARKKLNLIIIENKEILERLLSITKQ